MSDLRIVQLMQVQTEKDSWTIYAHGKPVWGMALVEESETIENPKYHAQRSMRKTVVQTTQFLAPILFDPDASSFFAVLKDGRQVPS